MKNLDTTIVGMEPTGHYWDKPLKVASQTKHRCRHGQSSPCQKKQRKS